MPLFCQHANSALHFSRTSVLLLTVLVLTSIAPEAVWAQSVQVVSPQPNAILTAGDSVTVEVEVIGGNPEMVGIASAALGAPLNISAPPFRWTLVVLDEVGVNTLVAVAKLKDGRILSSNPVSFTVQHRADAVTRLIVQDSKVTMLYVGYQRYLPVFAEVGGIVGKLGPGALFTITDPAVLSVTPAGMVTAKAPGASTVTVRYGNLQATVAFSVPSLARGDLNGDGDVDTSDINRVQLHLNSNATTPMDSRDLNRDGRIDTLDLRVLTTLCTRARCATY